MEQIINVLGKRYIITSDRQLTQEHINNIVKLIEASGGDLKKLETVGRCVQESGYFYGGQMGCKIRDSCTGEFLTGWFECYTVTQVLVNLIAQGKCGSCPPPPCTPSWTCELPLNGYESDGCGNRRLNAACNPTCTPSWTCELPLNGYESDGCGNRQINTICNPTGGCIPSWKCEQPLNGLENDGCGNKRPNTICNPTGGCISSWTCEQPLNGYENDGCGNKRPNTSCNPSPSGLGTGTIVGIALLGVGALGVMIFASRKK